MSSCPEGREELASYALGLLDEPENLLFEAHLVDCSGCARELEDILHTVEDLALVARDDDAFAELAGMVEPQPRFVPRESADFGPAGALHARDFESALPGPRVLRARETGPRGASREGALRPSASRPGSQPVAEKRPRKRLRRPPWRGRRAQTLLDPRRRRRLPALVAVAAVVLVSAGLAVLLIGPGSGSHNTARADESPAASAAPSAARQLQNTDPRTGAHLVLVVTAGPFGTRLTGELSKVTGPRRCRLVAIGTTGATDAISSWLVPPSGYGTPANPQPLKLQGTTSLTAQQIARVEVQDVDPAGRTSVLVAVEIH